jgi:single-strand DNA-binding protein
MLNLIILQGRLVADVELKTSLNGKSFVNFNIAVNRYVKDKDHPEADFFTIVAWEKTAEFINQYFAKGDQIIIEGSVRTGTYEDKEGIKRKKFEVLARQVDFAGTKKKEDENGKEADEFDEEDLPF